MDARKTFNRLVGHLDYPMFIVTARAGEERLGCLIGFATQISIHPPRFAVCLSHKNRTFRHGREATHLGVHCVSADSPDIAELFGGNTGDDVDKFGRTQWHDGPHGVPIIDACEDWFVGEVLEHLDAGDHDLFVLEPVAAHGGDQGDQFKFHRAKRIEPGHAP
jgi:flavin reductase (DIM6/NTAB) family NADH-FMN oxidoreductase RutF